mmetsp:Transcript_58795/g.116498  ORF Transcript_58795/g.116498 Transcript_58795/m.116498 type:complete len:342 (-) Transcript_58795:64-1089(-)|eukprot:CAMPEP_0172664828 /NCGR_PEP_ID=MMETSP1074-20121228/6854_1 /TAXON_ID=2916 /ORGANISM="Ceratium fusus, Strain PA161109" /LENGTH=341 /DNA_ID=CAMNT_0013481049 /DNA_START=147 /DNA_END=1172 /DNA_ORIENTATION=-
MPDIDPDDEDAVYKPLRFLPIVYVLMTISSLWVIYMFCHVIPRLQVGVTTNLVEQPIRLHAQIECGLFNYITVMLLLCYARSMLTHPGEIPTDDPKWDYNSAPKSHIELKEKKRSGDRRHCKWCGKYKPDRCHHCRVCRICILKMDHHCPWIYNCVGFYNYKYFFLLIMYSAMACQFMFFSMWTSVWKSFLDEEDLMPMFILVFGQTLSFFLAILLTTFWGFHVWLMFMAMTTIEFCEKSMPKSKSEEEHDPGLCGCDCRANVESPYDLGTIGNICAVLGRNPIFWLFPVWNVSGDGLVYDTEETPLLYHQGSSSGMSTPADLEATRIAQRPPVASSGAYM